MNDYTQQRRDADAKLDGLPTFAEATELQKLREKLDAEPVKGVHFTNRMQEQVRKFHAVMGQPVGTEPRALPADRVPVRVELIREEFIDELIPALESGDIVETIDACIDILYVTFGLLVEMGVDAAPFFDEVQASNMSKLGADGRPIVAGPNDPDGIFEGRVKKGPNYFRPNLAGVLADQLDGVAETDEDDDLAELLDWDDEIGDPNCPTCEGGGCGDCVES